MILLIQLSGKNPIIICKYLVTPIILSTYKYMIIVKLSIEYFYTYIFGKSSMYKRQEHAPFVFKFEGKRNELRNLAYLSIFHVSI